MTANAQQETFKVRKVILPSPGKVIMYLHNCSKALQDWHVTPGGGRGGGTIVFAQVIKKDIKI